MSSSKIINIEILRALAIVSVILIHMSMGHFYDIALMSQNFYAWIANNIYYTSTRFCVPVFFIIATYISYYKKSTSTWKDKLIRIGLPYIFWSAVYYYYEGGDNIFDLIKKTLTSNTSFHLWFLPPFLGFVILLPAINKIFHDHDCKKQFKHLFCLLFIFSIFAPSVINFLNFFYGNYDFLYGINNFGLSISGLLMFAFSFHFMYKKINVKLGLGAYFLLITINLLLNISVSARLANPNEYFYGYTTLLVFISSFIFFNSIMSIDFSWLPSWSSGLIYKIGNCSFGIYLAHWLIYNELNRYGLIFHSEAVIDPLLNTCIVFFISFLIISIARKFKPFKYLC